MNDYQKYRFAKQIIDSLFNTVSGKKIAILGWAFKKDTNDTRESAAVYVVKELLDDRAEIHVYDPKVTKAQILHDLKYLAASSQATYGEGHPELVSGTPEGASVFVHDEPYGAMADAHAIAIMTEWDEFKTYDWQKVYNNMLKPAFVFDGRNIFNVAKFREIGFEYKSIGKS